MFSGLSKYKAKFCLKLYVVNVRGLCYNIGNEIFTQEKIYER